MTEVEFHTGIADPVGFVCRLLRKAFRQGARVLVTAPPETLAALDRALWTFDERDFVPHVRLPAATAATAARTPIWLASDAADAGASGAPRLVVNVGAEAPADAAALERLIEVVAADAEAVAGGRARWRGYRQAGLAIKHHGGGSGGA